jgi:hypothetical protein
MPQTTLPATGAKGSFSHQLLHAWRQFAAQKNIKAYLY